MLCQRGPRLFALLAQARREGRYARLFRQFVRVNPLIPDDRGLGESLRKPRADK